jgi:hypothetical protein
MVVRNVSEQVDFARVGLNATEFALPIDKQACLKEMNKIESA